MAADTADLVRWIVLKPGETLALAATDGESSAGVDEGQERQTDTMHTTKRDWDERIHLGEPWSPTWLQFEVDMTRLGLAIHECHGAGWGGPAVTVPQDRLVAVESATKVKLEHHEVERDQVMVYPAEVDRRTGLTFAEWLAATT